MQNGGYHGKTKIVSKTNNINRNLSFSVSVNGDTEVSASSMCIGL